MWAKKTVLALKINHELIKGWSLELYVGYMRCILTHLHVDYTGIHSDTHISSLVSRVFHIFYSSSRDGNFH